MSSSGAKRVAANDPIEARPSSPKKRRVADEEDADPTVGAPTPEEAKCLESLLVDLGVEFYDRTSELALADADRRIALITTILTTSTRSACDMCLSHVPSLPRDAITRRMHWLYAMLCARMIRDDSSVHANETIYESLSSAHEALRDRRRGAEILTAWHSLSQLKYFIERPAESSCLVSLLHWHNGSSPSTEDVVSFLLERLAEEDAGGALPGACSWVDRFVREYERAHSHRFIELVMERFAARVPLFAQGQLCLFRALAVALRESESPASAPTPQYFTCSVIPAPLELLAFRSGQQRESMVMEVLTSTGPISFYRDLARMICAYLGGQKTHLAPFGRLDPIDPNARKEEREGAAPLALPSLGGGGEFDEEPLLWMSVVCSPDVSSLLGPNVPDEVFDERRTRREAERRRLRNECIASSNKDDGDEDEYYNSSDEEGEPCGHCKQAVTERDFDDEAHDVCPLCRTHGPWCDNDCLRVHVQDCPRFPHSDAESEQSD